MNYYYYESLLLYIIIMILFAHHAWCCLLGPPILLQYIERTRMAMEIGTCESLNLRQNRPGIVVGAVNLSQY